MDHNEVQGNGHCRKTTGNAEVGTLSWAETPSGGPGLDPAGRSTAIRRADFGAESRLEGAEEGSALEFDRFLAVPSTFKHKAKFDQRSHDARVGFIQNPHDVPDVKMM